MMFRRLFLLAAMASGCGGGSTHTTTSDSGLSDATVLTDAGVDAAAGYLRVDYDSDQVSPAAASRVLGYLQYALAQAVSTPHELVDLADMLSADERHHQLHVLCGPRVDNGQDGFIPASAAFFEPSQQLIGHLGNKGGRRKD